MFFIVSISFFASAAALPVFAPKLMFADNLFLIFLARFAYFRVFSVSAKFESAGDTRGWAGTRDAASPSPPRVCAHHGETSSQKGPEGCRAPPRPLQATGRG